MTTSDSNMAMQQAYETLYRLVYAPAFFKRLADVYGIKPCDPKQAKSMKRMASKLRALSDGEQHQEQNERKKAGTTKRLAQRKQTLDKKLASLALAEQSLAKPTVTPEVTAAAAALAQEPELRAALVTLLAAKRPRNTRTARRSSRT